MTKSIYEKKEGESMFSQEEIKEKLNRQEEVREKLIKRAEREKKKTSKHRIYQYFKAHHTMQEKGLEPS